MAPRYRCRALNRYMFIMSCIFGLISGAVGPGLSLHLSYLASLRGFYSTFMFVRGIYGSIKID